MQDMFSGGTETTAATMEWAMAELRVMKKAQAEIRQLLTGNKKTFREADIQELSYLKLVIKESLRLHPPVPLLVPRECREQCVIDGYEIPLKTRVIINAWAIGRDPNNWEDAESFIPERFVDNPVDYKGASFEFTPFGAGRRMCPLRLVSPQRDETRGFGHDGALRSKRFKEMSVGFGGCPFQAC